MKSSRWRPGPRRTSGPQRAGPTGRTLATMLFTDIVGSTELASRLGDRRWRALRDLHDRVVRRELKRFDGREIDTAGDGFFAVFSGLDQAIACAGAVMDELAEIGIPIRAGLHMGEVEPAGDKITGVAVNIGARIAARAGPGEILVSSTVRDLVSGSETAFEDRGTHELKGVTGNWRLFAVAREPLDLKPLPEKLAAPARAPRRRRRLWPAVALLLVGGTAWGVTALLSGDERPQAPPTDAGPGFREGIARIDPETNEVVAKIEGPRLPGAGYLANPIAAGEGAVWMVGPDVFFIGAPHPPTVKVNPATDSIVAKLAVRGSGVAVGYGRVWVAGGRDGVVSIDPMTNRVTPVPNTGKGEIDPAVGPVRPPEHPVGIAVGDGSVWVTRGDGIVLRIDPARQRVEDRISAVGIQLTGIAVDEGGEEIWVVDPADGAAIRLDPKRGRVTARVTMSDATDVAIGEGSVWVTNSSSDTVTQVDPGDASISDTITVGDGPTAIAIGNGAIWVANSRDGTISRIDPVSHEVEAIRVGGSPGGVTVGDGGVWVVVYRNAYVG